MVNNSGTTVEVGGHLFPIRIHDDYYELHLQGLTESGVTPARAVYQGPLRRLEDLDDELQHAKRTNPSLSFMWRKCKTVLAIETRCNQEVWRAAQGDDPQPATSAYLSALCGAHIAIINRLIQSYRLATYDYFPYEVAPWDVPRWLVRVGGASVGAALVPYKAWDQKPLVTNAPGAKPAPYQLIDDADLSRRHAAIPTPGELELLDALNLMERGDYSGAVRRVTTAIEVVVEAMVRKEVEAAEGPSAADKFLNESRMSFGRRLQKYEVLTKRKPAKELLDHLNSTRTLRHHIVHRGYRISPGERGRAQQAVDTGRWLFNWFENDAERQRIREKRIGMRSLGRDLVWGMFQTRITSEGVVVEPIPVPRSQGS